METSEQDTSDGRARQAHDAADDLVSLVCGDAVECLGDAVNDEHHTIAATGQNGLDEACVQVKAGSDLVELSDGSEDERQGKCIAPHALRHIDYDWDQLHGIEEHSKNHLTIRPKAFPVEIHFHSRNHRKGRFHRLLFLEEISHQELHKLKRITWASWEPENVSWWVAFIFTLGSICWVFNGSFSMWPVPNATTNLYLTQYFALAGATLFEIGAYFSVLEALNPRSRLEFGFEVQTLLEKSERRLSLCMAPDTNDLPKRTKEVDWVWFGWKFNDAGEKAAMTQMVGATLFLCSCIVGVPRRYSYGADLLIPQAEYILQDIFFWSFQIVASCLFMYASLVLVLETQTRWDKPNFRSLGWNLSVLNFIGGLGFFLCAVFGLLANVNGRVICCQYWGTLFSSFVGSCAFLAGSYLLVIEVANKHPVTVLSRHPSVRVVGDGDAGEG
eukprot:CAMPEP_0203768128 /NCGR_PEP_ID=MMETSP0099_2-20121227/1399_1 /ASSEMBLY_ACC=CAM_ASM_000209 /TAXON_ID=96639 /ORGANISM=" , Strain NY0313808BC1" /LENGTH=442 /DNA_ID=CAMNT_0050664751 /DNA_START=68 /DNA_END=1392 /DNA_ORIENTATION=+